MKIKISKSQWEEMGKKADWMRPVKSMPRELTAEEKSEILNYLKAHETEDITNIIKTFEAKFNIPITEHCIERIIVESL